MIRVLPILLLLGACRGLSSSDTMDDQPDVQTREVSYQAGDTQLVGFLARDGNAAEPRPGVLVVHEWWGHNEYARGRARQLAELGYVALAIDMYGDGRQADHPEDAQSFMMEVMGNREVLEGRFRAALEFLHALPGVDASRTAAIGYCMGGAIALHMARIGTDLDAVATFHASLGTETPAELGAVRAELLVTTGADDPFVPPEQVQAFREEMERAGATLDVIEYPGVVHGFTNPGATELGERFELPLRYDANADQASWAALQAFLARVLAR